MKKSIIKFLKSRFIKKPITITKSKDKIIITIETSNDSVFDYIKKDFYNLFKTDIKNNNIVLKLKKKCK
jgi:hypothetical protein